VSALHAHLVFVTKYRRPVFSCETPTSCEHTTHAMCAALDAELVEFNREADHLHPPVTHPPGPAISALVQRLKGPTAYAARREYTGVRARMRGHLWSLSYLAVSGDDAPLSIINQYIHGHARPL
jgi:putative transposase